LGVGLEWQESLGTWCTEKQSSWWSQQWRGETASSGEHAGDTGASHEQDMSMGPKERMAACRYAAGIRCDMPIPSKFVVTNIKQQKCSGYFVSKNANLHQLHVTKYTYSIAHILPRKISWKAERKRCQCMCNWISLLFLYIKKGSTVAAIDMS